MPRKPSIIKTTRLEVYIPEDLRARLDLHLFSEAEGRVPCGKYSGLVNQLLRNYFAQLDQATSTRQT